MLHENEKEANREEIREHHTKCRRQKWCETAKVKSPLAKLKRSVQKHNHFADKHFTPTFYTCDDDDDDGENRICIILPKCTFHRIPTHATHTHTHTCTAVLQHIWQIGKRSILFAARTTQQNTKCDLTTLISSAYYMIFCCYVCAPALWLLLLQSLGRVWFAALSLPLPFALNSLLSYFYV